MKYFLDTEFIETGRTGPIDIISIGIVAEDGRELYYESRSVNWFMASDWVTENVRPHLQGGEVKKTPGVIASYIKDFCDPRLYGKPEFWGYYCDYDWVVLCQLFGTMMDLPQGWPKYCLDVKQWAVTVGNPKLPEIGKDEHHALADARWIKRAWDYLNEASIAGFVAGAST